MQKIMNPITIISKLFLHFINAPAGLIQILDVGRLPTLQGKTLGLDLNTIYVHVQEAFLHS